MSMWRLLPVVTSLGLAFAGALARADVCPESSICIRGTCTSSTVSARDTTVDNYDTYYGYSLGASYNLARGTASVFVRRLGDTGADATVRAEDTFKAEGPAPGTPLVFAATLHIRAGLGGVGPCGWGYADASFELREGNANAQSHYAYTCRAMYVDSVLRVAVARQAGEPFRLSYSLGCYAQMPGNGASADVELRFEDLPPGVTIASCQGYGGPPVPVQSATWGQLKASYR